MPGFCLFLFFFCVFGSVCIKINFIYFQFLITVFGVLLDLQVVKQEGWDRLYGGLAPSLVGTAASQVRLDFLLYANVRRVCNHPVKVYLFRIFGFLLRVLGYQLRIPTLLSTSTMLMCIMCLLNAI